MDSLLTVAAPCRTYTDFPYTRTPSTLPQCALPVDEVVLRLTKWLLRLTKCVLPVDATVARVVLRWSLCGNGEGAVHRIHEVTLPVFDHIAGHDVFSWLEINGK